MSNFNNVKNCQKAIIAETEKLNGIKFENAKLKDVYAAVTSLVNEEISKNWKSTKNKIEKKKQRQVIYFSMEFLMGRMLTSNLMNLGVRGVVGEALNELGFDINEIESAEADAGLGNGGLGRLAACFVDSIASLGYPGHGNTIRYNYGFFEQKLEDGYQVERPDRWLSEGYPWEVVRPEEAEEIGFYGTVEENNGQVVYKPAQIVKALPFDMPIVGHDNGVVTDLRMWSAMPSDVYPSDIDPFKYNKEVREISDQLYPDDSTEKGRELRVKQQYFFSAAGVRSALKKHKERYGKLDNLSDKLCFQLNDTHPTLVIPELMRILVDEEGYGWRKAWNITTKTCAYTNHTILAEALEKWPTKMIKKLLPRIYQIIVKINKSFNTQLKQKFGDDKATIEKMAIIGDKQVRMAHLAIFGSYSVNGVAALHTEILKAVTMKDFHEFFEGKFNNKTNGITHRRWLLHTNPELVAILEKTIGTGWIKNPSELEKLLPFADDKKIQAAYYEMKQARKQALVDKIKLDRGIEVDVNSIFDIQVKRLHEYKRQLMNAFHIMYLYNRMKKDADFKANFHPQTFIFGAKSAPSYVMAKAIIKYINTIADLINNDTDVNDKIKVVFVENYNVTYAETIMPAADLSEQISTASKEASGTGNMKFMMNGALTIGTMDGANVEIVELVGKENAIIFGMESDEVNGIYADFENNYDPKKYYESDARLKEIIDQLDNGFFGEPNEALQFVKNETLGKDYFLVLKDFDAYVKAQEEANAFYKDRDRWLKASIINTAKSGKFSSDRTIEDYVNDIWKVKKIG